MRTIRIAVLLACCLVLLGALWSCQTPAGRTAGQVVDDNNIFTEVKAKLFNDPMVSGFAISVEVFKGEVTLTGGVPTSMAKARATELARSANGVIKVNNLLKVK